jgi:hypothetical protein
MLLARRPAVRDNLRRCQRWKHDRNGECAVACNAPHTCSNVSRFVSRLPLPHGRPENVWVCLDWAASPSTPLLLALARNWMSNCCSACSRHIPWRSLNCRSCHCPAIHQHMHNPQPTGGTADKGEILLELCSCGDATNSKQTLNASAMHQKKRCHAPGIDRIPEWQPLLTSPGLACWPARPQQHETDCRQKLEEAGVDSSSCLRNKTGRKLERPGTPRHCGNGVQSGLSGRGDAAEVK